jgi:hypothetical protein
MQIKVGIGVINEAVSGPGAGPARKSIEGHHGRTGPLEIVCSFSDEKRVAGAIGDVSDAHCRRPE